MILLRLIEVLKGWHSAIFITLTSSLLYSELKVALKERDYFFKRESVYYSFRGILYSGMCFYFISQLQKKKKSVFPMEPAFFFKDTITRLKASDASSS